MKSFLILFILGIVGVGIIFYSDYSAMPTRNPAMIMCRYDTEACRSNSDCCSYNCKSNICSRKINNKAFNGEPCLYDSNCNSGYCSSYRVCAPTANYRSDVGQFCLENDIECTSNFCDRSIHRCRGSSSARAYVGQFCLSNFECASGNCHPEFFRCLGGGNDLARYWELCTFDEQCSSGFCNKEYLRCMTP